MVKNLAKKLLQKVVFVLGKLREESFAQLLLRKQNKRVIRTEVWTAHIGLELPVANNLSMSAHFCQMYADCTAFLSLPEVADILDIANSVKACLAAVVPSLGQSAGTDETRPRSVTPRNLIRVQQQCGLLDNISKESRKPWRLTYSSHQARWKRMPICA